jgi:nucleoside recognition membrane protein YjiH
VVWLWESILCSLLDNIDRKRRKRKLFLCGLFVFFAFVVFPVVITFFGSFSTHHLSYALEFFLGPFLPAIGTVVLAISFSIFAARVKHAVYTKYPSPSQEAAVKRKVRA